jgi:hypothetical protein
MHTAQHKQKRESAELRRAAAAAKRSAGSTGSRR